MHCAVFPAAVRASVYIPSIFEGIQDECYYLVIRHVTEPGLEVNVEIGQNGLVTCSEKVSG